MTALELTGAITALANAVACGLSEEEIGILASIFVQLGDTLATIGVLRGALDEPDVVATGTKNGENE